MSTSHHTGVLPLSLYWKIHRMKREYRRTIIRARIYQIIVSNPGIGLKGIKREYEKDGYSRVWRVSLLRHVRLLVMDGSVKSKRSRWMMEYSGSGMSPKDLCMGLRFIPLMLQWRMKC